MYLFNYYELSHGNLWPQLHIINLIGAFETYLALGFKRYNTYN